MRGPEILRSAQDDICIAPLRKYASGEYDRLVEHAHHAHSHAAPHAHSHVHAPASYDRVFAIGIGLNLIIVLVQVGFGFLAGSLALLADAGHNLSDVMALLLAW